MKLFLCVLVFTLTYVVYHLTLFPSVSGGDSGELLAEACHLGTAHPPGYPLFTLLSHFTLSQHFRFLPRVFIDQPSGDLAIDTSPTSGWKMNHLTAFFGSFASVFVAITCYEIICVTIDSLSLRRKGIYAFTPSAMAALLYAFSPLVWEHSIGAEVFALNNLLCAMVVYLTCKVIIGVYTTTSKPSPSAPAKNSISKSGKQTHQPIVTQLSESQGTHTSMSSFYILLGSFCCGLALSNQHASLLLLVVAIPTVLIATSQHNIDLFLLFKLAMMFGLGLVSYNYLFIASLHSKPGSWGDLGNIPGLLGHVLRKEYGTFSLGMTLGSEGCLERIWIYLLHLYDDKCFHTLMPVALFGLATVLRDHGVWTRLVSSFSKKKRSGGVVLAGGRGKQLDISQKSKNVGKQNRRRGDKGFQPKVTVPLEDAKVSSSPSIVKGATTPRNLKSRDGETQATYVEAKQKALCTDIPKVAERDIKAGSFPSKSDVNTATKNVSSEKKAISKPNLTEVQSPSISTSDGRSKIAPPAPVDTELVIVAHPDGQYWSISFLFIAWVFYIVVWNGVLSNIPLSAPMPYGVHARFWMQPNIIFYVFVSLGMSSIVQSVLEKLFPLKTIESKGTNEMKRNPFFSLCDIIIQTSIVTILMVILLQNRFDAMDKSGDGWVMHEYGNYILQSTTAHSDSLLLSHTDLNWNSIRYLQVCESVKTDTAGASPFNLLDSVTVASNSSSTDSADNMFHATHLNFQLMPFPWFPKKQAPLYPNVIFPPMFQGVSTQRMTVENAYLIERFLSANIDHVNKDKPVKLNTIWGNKRPIFLDMQAINDLHIDTGGTWRNFTLIPWGLVYLVHERKTVYELGSFHVHSLNVLKILRRKFLPLLHDGFNNIKLDYNLTTYFHDEKSSVPIHHVDVEFRIPFLVTPRPKLPFMTKYPPGSWEYAVVSTFHDGHNQLGLNLLSYAMEMQKSAKKHGDLLIIVDRLFVAADLMLACINSIENLVEASTAGGYGQEIAFSGQRYAEGYAPLSTPFVHLLKNTALCLMRLESLLVVGVKFRDTMHDLVTSKDSTALVFQELLLLDGPYLVSKLTDNELKLVRSQAIESIELFLNVGGNDKDIPSFQNSLRSLRNSVNN